jgi:hypothetical protein
MKKTSSLEPTPSSNELRLEYRFDYQKARPNRFADLERRQRLAVVLDKDVAEIFTTADAVNRALRALLKGVPESEEPGDRGQGDRVVAYIDGSFGADERLQDIVAASLKELTDMGYSVSARQIKRPARSQTHAAVMLSLVIILEASLLLLTFRGLDTILADTGAVEGSQNFVASMRIYLETLAPFVKLVLGGGAVGLAVKAWRTWIIQER